MKTSQQNSIKPILFEIDIKSYPKIYQNMINYFSSKQHLTKATVIQRHQLHGSKFYDFTPSLDSNFNKEAKPVLDEVGLKFKHLQVSLNTNQKADHYPFYDQLLKPLGFMPDDRPVIPDIVYMIVDKK